MKKIQPEENIDISTKDENVSQPQTDQDFHNDLEISPNQSYSFMFNKHDRTHTIFFQYPEETKIQKPSPSLKEFNFYPEDDEEQQSIRKNYCVTFKAYKNVPNCITVPMEINGMVRTKSYVKANIIWKLLKYDKMSSLIKKLNCFQRFNHFPCTWQIGRKDNLWRNFKLIRAIHGEKHFNYLPETYILPEDLELFESKMKTNPPSNCLKSENKENEYLSENIDSKSKPNYYIIKPVASSRGRGIRILTSLDTIPKKCLISSYINNPHTINNKKYDLRLYVLITNFSPLKIYLYKEGLARFASEDYINDENTIHNKYVHLTNYSINKSSQNFDKAISTQDDQTGSKWSLSALKEYFKKNNLDYEKLYTKIKDIVVKSVISITSKTIESVKELTPHKNCLFELYGYDILVDSNLDPWLIEVNLNPSLNTDTELDFKIKSMLMSDIYTILGIRPYSHVCDSRIGLKGGPKRILLLEDNRISLKGDSLELLEEKENCIFIYFR